MLIDVHAHLDHFKFKDDLDIAIDRAKKAGVKTIITNGTNPETNRLSLKIAEKYDIVKASLGIYPLYAIDLGLREAAYPMEKMKPIDVDNELRFIESKKNEIIAIGEVGLDYSVKGKEKEQKETFNKIIELAEKIKLIAQLEAILKSEKKIFSIIKDELARVKEKYGDERRTKVIKSGVGEFRQEDLVPNEEAIITLSKDGYIKRMNPTVYKVQKRGGKGVIGATTREGDEIQKMLGVMAHDNLLFFTNTGKVFQTKAYEIPETSRYSKGGNIANFLNLSDERINAIIPIKEFKEGWQESLIGK